MQGSPRDRSKLSTDPRAVRARARRAGDRVHAQLDRVREEMVKLPNYKPIEDWDLEELARGRPRGKDGRFHHKPRWLGMITTEEIKRRLREKTYEGLAGHASAAIDLIGQLIENGDIDEYGRPIVDARTKLDAAKFIVEHIVGKAKVHVDVDTSTGMARMLATVIINPDGTDEATGEVIDGEWEEVVEDDGDPESGTESELPGVQHQSRGSRRPRA